jgi:hypothetical protein
MTKSASNPSFINNSARCIFFYPNGRRCRLNATAVNLNFCPTHAPLPASQSNPAEIALTANLDDFTSAAQINNFLSRLLLLLAQDKNLHPPRRRPRLHHQPTPPHPPLHRQGGKR